MMKGKGFILSRGGAAPPNNNMPMVHPTFDLIPEVDADSHAVKYRKRRSVRDSPRHLAGLVILFTLVLGAWHYGVPRHSSSSSHITTTTRKQQAVTTTTQQTGVKLPQSPFPVQQHRDVGRRLEEVFLSERSTNSRQLNEVLNTWLSELNADIVKNVHGGIRWVRPYLLPSINEDDDTEAHNLRGNDHPKRNEFLKVSRKGSRMRWEDEWEAMLRAGDVPGPIVDYTDKSKYTYPNILREVPPPSEYPPLSPMGELMANWNHDEDYEGTIHESLLHFNYSDPEQRAMAIKFRDAELPFKLYDIPEIDEASKKWTVDYVNDGFKDANKAQGKAQESPNNFFAFFIPKQWNVLKLGLAPVRNNDWNFRKFYSHAQYADAVRLSPDQPHFYWQSGVPREQRNMPKDEWGFISKDLPSFSSTSETFFQFHPEEQKGIQCRFGERGVVAATHYDSGMNFVGMISGAKRYILSPPRTCPQQGMFTSHQSPIYRHSLLNFAHMKHLNDPDCGMSAEERAWLERASHMDSIETVLKQGEALYIPSHWFHYIVSLQYSAQCNVRSGINHEGNPAFGSRETVTVCRDY